MASKDNEDGLEGDVRGRRAQQHGASLFRPPSAVDSKRVEAKQRAAWFNRSRGAQPVKLAHERPAGQQRVIVKLKPVVHGAVGKRGGGGGGGDRRGGGAGAVMRHALYVERDGAGRDGDPVQVFDRDHDRADGARFVDRCEDDRHHFRVIVSPEHGGELEDLKEYTRALMEQSEKDLRTRLDWIAAEHHDTGHPHVHVLIRGRHEDGRDLVIPRSYVSHGFRDRAEELATDRLGPRLEPDRDDRAVKLERVTHLDRDLIARARDHEVAMAELPDDGARRARLVQRLNRLEEWGLAQQERPGVWRLDRDLEASLTRLADRSERERATARLCAQERRGLEAEHARELEAAHASQRVTGRLVGFERLGDDPHGPHLIGVEGVDGKFWTARVARLEDLRTISGVQRGAIVEIERAAPDIKPSDRTIWEIARENGLTYSAEVHRDARPGDRDSFIQMHERRLEALRREGIVERSRDGRFHLPEDYPARVAAREGLGGRESARVSLIDPHTLEQQAAYRGPTWLDRVGHGIEDRSQFRDEGFGAETAEAWKQRRETLGRFGLSVRHENGFFAVEGWREHLERMEGQTLQDRVERDTGQVISFAGDGDRVEGLYKGRIDLAEQSYALIERGRTVTLAPWRPEMDRALNQFVSGRVNGHVLDFQYGREVEKSIRRGLDLGR